MLKCESCQKYTLKLRRPPSKLIPIRVARTFVQWGIDLVGPFAKSKKSYIIVVIYYFSKWIEAKSLVPTMKFHVIKFFKSRIISRYGIPNVLINTNGSQFAGKELKWLCEGFKIEHRYASVKHAKTNGQVEARNKIIFNGMKKRLDALKRRWT